MLTPAYTGSSAPEKDESLCRSNSCQSPLTSVLAIDPVSDVDNSLLDLYYEYFHPSHPFVLPRAALQTKLVDESSSLHSLTTIMQYIGSFYKETSRKDDSINFNANVTIDGFAVQTTLLLALAKSMCTEQASADGMLTKAIKQAQSIGMHTRAYADAASVTDPVLAESWRRTWWMLYLVDSNFAVIRRTYTPFLDEIDHYVDLPCDEKDYGKMDIPQTPNSLEQYRNSQYALEDKDFSSFSYLIDASRIFVSSLRAATQYENISKAETLCDDLEAAAIGWLLMLPPEKRELEVKAANLDQLMFQGHMMIYTALAYIHRPLSNLQYDPAEGLSTCGSPPPPLVSYVSVSNALSHRTHSEKLMKAVRKQNQCLILLPIGVAQLSPFLICMVACCTIAHLVACKSAFNPDEAEVARSRIKVCLGTLRHYEDIWPRAKKILRELRTVANSLLRVGAASSAPEAGLELMGEPDAMFSSFLESEWPYSLG